MSKEKVTVESFLGQIDSLKCMVVGDAAVGKTCMLISYSNNEFPKEYNPTVFDNYTANVVFKGNTVALGLWDTAGTDEYDQLRPLSYPDTHIFIIVFSVASAESLQNVENKWVKEIKEHADGIPYILVGNKSDLRNEEKFKSQCVPISECEKIRKKVGAEKLMECSAKTQEGLREVFDSCIQVTFEAYQRQIKKGGKNKDCLMM